jgi:hypothetical protein
MRDAFAAALVSALVLSVPLQPFTGIDRLRKSMQRTLARRKRFGSSGIASIITARAATLPPMRDKPSLP